MKYADLHLHTIYSDGTYTPESLVAASLAKGLSCIAVTDHDTVSGIEPVTKEAKGRIEVIGGVELSVREKNTELHIIGYFIDCKNPEFLEKLKEFRAGRLKRTKEMLKKLKDLGIEISLDSLISEAGTESVGRLHIARIMCKNGLAGSIQEVFNKYIGRYKPAFVDKPEVNISEAISLIHNVGGIAILAHPGNRVKDKWVEEFVGLGLDGIEVYHTGHNPSLVGRYKKLAEKLGILIVGGSDCHGENKGEYLIGKVKLPYSYVEELKKAREALSG